MTDEKAARETPSTLTPSTTLTPERHKLYLDLQMVTAGYRTDDVICALVDSLAASIAFASESRQHARRVVRDTSGDLNRAIDNNWEYVRSVRAQATIAGEA